MVIAVLSLVSTTFAQKKAKPSVKKPAAAIKETYKKPVFLDIDGKEVSQSEFADGIFGGEVGVKSSTNAQGKIVRHVPLTEVVLKDESDRIISPDEYRAKLASDKFKIDEIVEKNEVVGLRLKKYPLLDQPAPDFLAVTLESQAFTLANQKGKLTVLNFWFIGCVPCMEEMPHLNKIAEKYKNKSDLTFLAVSIDSTERLKEFLTKNRFDFQIVNDKHDMTRKFQANINGFPTTVIIDGEGKIVFYRSYLGKDAKTLDKAIANQLNEMRED